MWPFMDLLSRSGEVKEDFEALKAAAEGIFVQLRRP